MARILIADHRELIRLGLRAALPPSSGVVAEASTGPDAIVKAERAKPDLVIIAEDISGVGLAEVIDAIRIFNAETDFLVLVDETNAPLLKRLAASRVGYLRRDASAESIATLIENLHATARKRTHGTGDRPSSAVDKLSPRQLRVARLVADGFRTREIAQLLRMSERTVSAHRTEITKRLGLRSSAGIGKFL
jgi:two-component system nitrate/nitrite response regulator NarP